MLSESHHIMYVELLLHHARAHATVYYTGHTRHRGRTDGLGTYTVFIYQPMFLLLLLVSRLRDSDQAENRNANRRRDDATTASSTETSEEI